MKNKPQNINIDERELRKRRRERITMIVVGLMAIAFTLIASRISQRDEVSISTNILVYGLTSINVILIILLFFLIVRNVVKVFYERRRGIIGS